MAKKERSTPPSLFHLPEASLTGASIATHCDGASTLPTVGQLTKFRPLPAVHPSVQVKEALELGWIVFGFSFVKSEAISQEVVAATILGAPNDYRTCYQAMMQALQSGSDKDLRTKYPLEYNSHRNAKRAPKTRGIAFDPRLSDFRSFLRHMGPCPATDAPEIKNKRFTLERIKGKVSGYRIGNLEWASKRKQTSTRNVARWQKLKDGRQVTIKQLACLAGKKYNTIYKQLAAGKSPDEILTHVPVDLMSAWEWPPHLEHLEHAFRKRTKRAKCRLLWAIELFRNYLFDAQSEGLSEEEKKLGIALHELETERTQRVAKMKADKKAGVLAFTASISAGMPNPFLAHALPSLPAA